MARALETQGLPRRLAKTLWPWIDVIEMATGGMGDRVRLTTENTVASLRGQIAMTPPLETALVDALHASDALARDLDRVSFLQSDARTEALLALNALIQWLKGAEMNKRPRVLDQGTSNADNSERA